MDFPQLLALTVVCLYAATPVVLGVCAVGLIRTNQKSRFAMLFTALASLLGVAIAVSFNPMFQVSKYPETNFIWTVVGVGWCVAFGALAGGLIDRRTYGPFAARSK